MQTLVSSFGEPHTGIHSYRIGPFALVDTVLTALVGIGIAHWYQFNTLSTLTFIAALFLVGELVHLVLGVKTSGAVMLKHTVKKHHLALITIFTLTVFLSS
jgi:hypothetical protein